MSVSTMFNGGGNNVNRYKTGTTGFSAGLSNSKGASSVPTLSNVKSQSYTYYEATATSYVVKSGDTLSAIAKKYGIRVEDLYEDNKDLIGSDPNKIYTGQELIIRGKEEEILPSTEPEPVLPPTNVAATPEPIPAPDLDTTSVLAAEPLVATLVQNSPAPITNFGTEVLIPSSVRQTGLCPNYTPYDRFYGKWNSGTKQKEIADQWGAAGKTSSNGIATLNDRYLVAVSTKFGKVGDNIDVVLEDGQVIQATIADVKGADATSSWGHVMTKSGAVDIIEWEASGAKEDINLGTWKNVKVDKIINYSEAI